MTKEHAKVCEAANARLVDTLARDAEFAASDAVSGPTTRQACAIRSHWNRVDRRRRT